MATPINRVRVVCALALTMATFCPTSAFTNVDLPRIGRADNGDKATFLFVQTSFSSSARAAAVSASWREGAIAQSFAQARSPEPSP